jgi:hypothetical protein
MRNRKPDLQFSNLGFAWACAPVTQRGARWMADNLAGERTVVGCSVMIEPRYGTDIVLGARADGLICHG